MHAIQLTDRQREVLIETLESTVSDLGMEIAETDRMSFRDELKARRQQLREVLSQLRGAAETPAQG